MRYSFFSTEFHNSTFCCFWLYSRFIRRCNSDAFYHLVGFFKCYAYQAFRWYWVLGLLNNFATFSFKYTIFSVWNRYTFNAKPLLLGSLIFHMHNWQTHCSAACICAGIGNAMPQWTLLLTQNEMRQFKSVLIPSTKDLYLL